MFSKVERWLSVRGRTYLTLTAPEGEGEVSQTLHTIVLNAGQHFTKKLLVRHLDRAFLMRHEDAACALIELMQIGKAPSSADPVLQHAPEAFNGIQVVAATGR